MRYLLILMMLIVMASPALSDSVSGITLDDSVARVREQYQGRILSAETRQTDRGPVHAIRVMTPDGLIKRVQINADTGMSTQRRRRPDR